MEQIEILKKLIRKNKAIGNMAQVGQLVKQLKVLQRSFYSKHIYFPGKWRNSIIQVYLKSLKRKGSSKCV